MRRKTLSKRVDRKKFSKSSRKIAAANVARPMRGGYRI